MISFKVYRPEESISQNFFFNIFDFSDPQKLEIFDSSFVLSKKARGYNWGHKFDVMFTELNLALNIRRYSFKAMYEVGAYVWPLKGYYLKNVSDKDVKNIKNLSERVTARLNILKDLIPDEIYQTAIDLAQFKKPEDVCTLARMDFDLSDFISVSDLDSYSGYLYEPLKENFLSNSGELRKRLGNFDSARKSIEETMLFCRDRDRKFLIGKYALVGETIECICDYDDDQQMLEIFGDSHAFLHAEFKSNVPEVRIRPDIGHKPNI